MSEHRLLIADDDPLCLSALAQFFEEEGFTVEAVDNGTAALDRLGSESYSLLITDLNMPGATGLELLAFIKKSELHLPAIIISANIDSEAREQASAMGAGDYIKKPIQLDDLLERVQSQLS